jgi:hypothetical protein
MVGPRAPGRGSWEPSGPHGSLSTAPTLGLHRAGGSPPAGGLEHVLEGG